MTWLRSEKWGLQLAWVLLGLGLVLLSGPIGDWYDFWRQRLWFGLSFLEGLPFGLDRAPGWLVLIAGWCCIAHGLGGARKRPSGVAAGFARMRFRLPWLPVPILGTLGTYVALAYHPVAPLVLTIDIENLPPGAVFQGTAYVRRQPWHSSRYGATFDYLFGVDLPPHYVKTSSSNQPHSEFRFAAGRFSLENWQPNLDQVSLDIEDEIQSKAALVLLSLTPEFQQAGMIRVTRQSLEECRPPSTRGACLIQGASVSLHERDIRVVVDLADIELEPYQDPPLYKSPYYK